MIVFMLFKSMNADALKPYSTYITTPTSFDCKYDSLTFVTKDKVSLAGWYIYSAQNDQNESTIIFSYGDAGNMSYFLDYGIELAKNGFNVFMYDYRGFGLSNEFPIDKDMLIYSEFLIDLNAAVDFVKENHPSPIILFGPSMGATLSISVAGSRQDILAVIAEGPYENTIETLKRVNLMQERTDSSRRFKNDSLFPLHSQPENAIRTFDRTAFYAFTGSADEIVTADVVFQLYSVCPSKFKSIWIAPGTDHANIISRYTDQYFNNIYVFLNDLLKK